MKQKLKSSRKREQKEVEKKIEDQTWLPVNHSSLEGYQNLNAEAQQIVQNYRQIWFQEWNVKLFYFVTAMHKYWFCGYINFQRV